MVTSKKKITSQQKATSTQVSKKEQIRLLEGLVEELAGIESGKIVDILFNKRDVNEFFIAKKMNLTINQVRNILYKLSAQGLVSFIRKKDRKKGWYIYYWTLDTEKCLIKLEQSILAKIGKFNAQLEKRETRRYYICPSCHIEVNEETALEHNFSCEECAEIYVLADNEKPIKEIKLNIAKAEKGLKIIQVELMDDRSKKAKKRAKTEKKEEALIKKEKDQKKAEKKKLREKNKKPAKDKKQVKDKKITKKISVKKKINKKSKKK